MRQLELDVGAAKALDRVRFGPKETACIILWLVCFERLEMAG